MPRSDDFTNRPKTASGANEAAPIGVLMLDTQFARLPGDVGNRRSWKTPVLFRTVRGADPANVVYGGAQGLLQPFIDAALELIHDGAAAITTSCGFLAIFQNELAEALPVPVFSSSLMQAPLIQMALPKGKRVGVLTFSAAHLTHTHLRGAGADISTPIQGVRPGGHFSAYYGNIKCEADFPSLERDVLEAARTLVEMHPDIGAILCECTNLPPHSNAIRRATGLPVYDIMGFVEWIARGLCPPVYRDA